jgi:hypothetical protein
MVCVTRSNVPKFTRLSWELMAKQIRLRAELRLFCADLRHESFPERDTLIIGIEDRAQPQPDYGS